VEFEILGQLEPLRERIIERVVQDESERDAVSVNPVPTRAARSADAASVETPQRTVHVRIGEIQIHAAPPAVAPEPVTTRPTQTNTRSGFEEYAHLRSYAAAGW
jgi:hypothetical protein